MQVLQQADDLDRTGLVSTHLSLLSEQFPVHHHTTGVLTWVNVAFAGIQK